MLLPAVDVSDGQAVRLVHGAAGTETSYGEPLAAALAWQAAGAEWVHLVDLDAAFGRGENRALLADVVARLDVQVEMSGGIRDDESLDRALATGCARVNIGTAALEDPQWCAKAIAEHGDKVAVGLDVRGTTLSARGWTKDGGELFEVLARLDGEGLRPLCRHRRRPGRHDDRSQPRPAAQRLRRDRPADRRLGRCLEPRRPARDRDARARRVSRARSSARRSMPRRSPSRTPWRRCG